MTIPEFLERLRQTPGPWVVVDQLIRCGCNCPIAVLGGVTQDEWFLGASYLGLSIEDRGRIVLAADIEGEGTLRRSLLAATVNR